MTVEHDELVRSNAEDSEPSGGLVGSPIPCNYYVSGPGKTMVNSGIANYAILNVIL